MRIVFVCLATLLISLCSPVTAGAADEFGARFSGEAPAALSDYEVSPEAGGLIAAEDAGKLSDIMPAAGDEGRLSAPAAQPDERFVEPAFDGQTPLYTPSSP